MINQGKQILKERFGYTDFRPLQQEVISRVLSGRDTLVIMPTGGGKSLCYQIPALMFPGLTIVVTPLISLMEDQVQQLSAVGVPAATLNSMMSTQAYSENVKLIQSGTAKLLYLAPETLMMDRTLSWLSTMPVSCLTIDEAHCISDWGHDFRPEYRQLIDVRKRFPGSVCLALTATATPMVRDDILNSLGFDRSGLFLASFDRQNLFLDVEPKSDGVEQTISFLKRFPNQSGIIYCLTRKQVDELSEILEEEGFSVKPYHAGLSDDVRRKNQELFIRDDVQIIVATVAFGMGINKPNVRFVLQYDLPKNIESYYQQIGRAGRDGLDSHCLLLFSYSDIHKISFFIQQKNDKEQQVAKNQLNAMVRYAESEICLREPLLRYFGESTNGAGCEKCIACTEQDQPTEDVTIAAQKFLSCVKRTGERFGAAHIIDVLRGSQAAKVKKFQHDSLSTYGIGMEHSKQAWFSLSRQFLQKGLMTQDLEFGSLQLTPKAWEVFRGNEKVLVKKLTVKPDVKPKFEASAEDPRLFELLRQLRKSIADEQNVPPYVVFPDKTLIEMASRYPQSNDSLLAIHGIGQQKAKTYGKAFLAAISEYCIENGIAEKKEVSNTVSRTKRTRSTAKLKFQIVSEAFNEGKTIEGLMQIHQVKISTILSHLNKWITNGNMLRKSDEFITLSNITKEVSKEVFDLFDAHSTHSLSVIKEAMTTDISYDALHLLRLHYLVHS